MKILVTGHKGFIGTYLTAELQAARHTVIGWDIRGEHQNGNILTMPFDWFDKVFHLAAKVDARSDNSLDMVETNVLGSLRLFEKYRDKVIFASSCAVHYDTPYGASKRAAEQFANFYGCGIVRLCNVYGFGGHSVVDIFRREPILSVAGDGKQLRTYAPVEDAVNMFLSCKPGQTLILKGNEWTVKQIADRHPNKSQRWMERGKWDIDIGVQLDA